MKAGELCVRQVITATSDESVIEAARRMCDQDVGALVVVETVGGVTRPIGIVTDRDIVTRVLVRGEPVAATVRDIMDIDLVTAFVDDDVDAVLTKLRRRAVRRVPIIGHDGSLQGILTLDDIVTWISEELSDAATLIDRQTRGDTP